MTTIFMPLLNEGTDVWRRVEATMVSDDTWRVEGVAPDDEDWAFAPGTVVRCAAKTFADGQSGIVATEAV